MLERLRIQNFKSWQDTDNIAFGSLTGFFGTNSSGKSSILQFLLMLKQTVESSDRSLVLDLGDEKTYVDLGTIYDILHGHQDPGELRFSFQSGDFNKVYDLEDDIADLMADSPLAPFGFTATVQAEKDKITLQRFAYTYRNHRYQFQRIADAEPYYTLTLDNRDTVEVQAMVGPFRNPTNFFGVPNSVYVNHPRFEDELQNIEASFYHFFDQIYYLGPLREYPHRLYTWAGSKPQSVGDRGEDTVAALLASRQQGPSIFISDNQPKRTVEAHVAHWLKELGLIYSFVVQPIAPNRKEYEVRIQRTAESASVFLTDVGFGVSQILPVLVLLFYVPEGSTVILEQPEIHLHPAVQAGLADVFIDAIKRRKLQIVLESHSEHLLQRLQRRMAEFTLEPEKAIDPDIIKLYFTSIKEGRSELTTLDLDEYGNIRNWPEGFFGDTLGEAAAMMKAEMKRKLREQQS